jgi:putative endonuclease
MGISGVSKFGDSKTGASKTGASDTAVAGSAVAGSVAKSRSVARRRAAETQGRRAELFVAAHWRSQGFEILAQRLRTKAGEIDLIVADPSTLVFVEVKSRGSFALGAHSVLPRQQSRLFQAADSVLADHDEWSRPNIRFDVALVCDGAIEHIRDAIRAC